MNFMNTNSRFDLIILRVLYFYFQNFYRENLQDLKVGILHHESLQNTNDNLKNNQPSQNFHREEFKFRISNLKVTVLYFHNTMITRRIVDFSQNFYRENLQEI